MEIILSKQCEALTGSLGRGFGYHIQRRKNGYYAKRNTKGVVPPDGHWKFIITCAELTQMKLHVSDIRVKRIELAQALWEAGLRKLADKVTENQDRLQDVMNASDIINFKNNNNL